MTTWTAERDQRLFLLCIDLIRPDFAAVAEAWKRTYVDTGIDSFQPTMIALRKHVAALKERAGNKTKKDGAAVGKGALKKVTKTTAPTQHKRKRTPKESDDESVEVAAIEKSEEEALTTGVESDAEASEAPMGPRNTPSRKAKTVLKMDHDGAADSSADESDESEVSNFSAEQ